MLSPESDLAAESRSPHQHDPNSLPCLKLTNVTWMSCMQNQGFLRRVIVMDVFFWQAAGCLPASSSIPRSVHNHYVRFSLRRDLRLEARHLRPLRSSLQNLVLNTTMRLSVPATVLAKCPIFAPWRMLTVLLSDLGLDSIKQPCIACEMIPIPRPTAWSWGRGKQSGVVVMPGPVRPRREL
jgi:hypothetical protein